MRERERERGKSGERIKEVREMEFQSEIAALGSLSVNAETDAFPLLFRRMHAFDFRHAYTKKK